MNIAATFRSRFDRYPRMLWLLGLGSFINVVGLSFIWPITTIYIHDHLGRSLTMAGVVLMLHSGGGALGSLIGGYLFDRIGARPVMLTGLLASAVLIGLPGLVESWPLYVTVMILYGVAATMVFPAMNALGAKAWPEGGRATFNFIYVAHNMGVAVGTALGGLVAQHSFQGAFLSAAAVAMLFAAFVYLFVHDTQRDPADRAQEGAWAEAGGPVPWLPVVALFAGFLMLWLIYVQWQGPIAVYMKGTGIPLSGYSLLWTLNGLVIVAGQPVIALVVRYVRSTAGQLVLGTVLYLASFGLLLAWDTYPAFVAAMVILTFGEMLLWPGIPAAVSEISPPARRGFLQGFIGSAATAGRMLGPLLGGLLYDRFGYLPVLAVMAGLLVVPGACFLVYRRAASVYK